VGAIIASSCCVVPLVLVILGISGAWVGTLTALEPYKYFILAPTIGLLGLAYRHVYFKPLFVTLEADCAPGTYCALPVSGRMTKGTLWIATAVVLVAATVDFWAPYFY
jgi:mercuric ion transport protein